MRFPEYKFNSSSIRSKMIAGPYEIYILGDWVRGWMFENDKGWIYTRHATVKASSVVCRRLDYIVRYGDGEIAWDVTFELAKKMIHDAIDLRWKIFHTEDRYLPTEVKLDKLQHTVL